MTPFVETGLGNALVALVLAVVALVVGLVCRRPAVGHALWLLVLIKLVTPPLMSVPLPWPAEVPLEVVEEPQFVAAHDEEPFEVVEEPFVERQEEPLPPESVEPMEDSSTPEMPYSAPSWQTVFGLAWLAGSSTWFAIAARRLWRFGRLLRHAHPASAELIERVAALSRKLGLRKPPRILLVQGYLSPMVWAAGRVTLLVPAKLVSQMSGPALDTLLAHELAHVRRRDHWVRWLELVGLGLYWWNPVVWLARRELRQAEELCCDAWVVRCLPDARRVYATALVDALDFLSRPDEPVPALGCGLGRVHDLKWRLTMILRGQTSPRLGWTTALGVFGLAVLLLPLVPGFSPAQPEPNPPKPVNPGIEQLDADSRARLAEEIKALVEKRVAEAKAKDQHLERQKQVFLLRMGQVRAAATAEDVRALEADIQAKTDQLHRLKERLKVVRVYPAAGKPDHGTAFRIEFAVKGSAQEIKATLEKIDKFLKELHVTDINARPVSLDPLLSPPPVSQRAVSDPSAWKREFDSRRMADPAGNRSGGVNLPAERAATAQDRRIDMLEKKLSGVLEDLEALRKSKTPPAKGTKTEDPFRKRATPDAASPSGGGTLPTPASRPGGN